MILEAIKLLNLAIKKSISVGVIIKFKSVLVNTSLIRLYLSFSFRVPNNPNKLDLSESSRVRLFSFWR